MSRYPRIDLDTLALAEGVDLRAALSRLKALYAEVDERNERNTRDLDMPCGRGCDGCCHESVFLTPLEFYGAWDLLQRAYDDDTLDYVVDEGLRIYDENQALIEALSAPPDDGDRDHTQRARALRFRCPMLGTGGACLVYPMREILARLFGCSFNDDGGIYGCHLVGAHLGGQTVRLVRARPMAMRVHELPLTDRQQVYPYYIHRLYGGVAEGVSSSAR